MNKTREDLLDNAALPYECHTGKMASDITTRNLATWMSDNRSVIGSRLIHHVALPGTHNSGIGGDNVAVWAKNQDTKIRYQLVNGIRYLDLRVGYCDKTNRRSIFDKLGFWFWHGDAAQSWLQCYEDGLKDIRNFLDTNTAEIVVIEFSWERGEPSKRDEALTMLLEHLGDYVCGENDITPVTINNMLQQKNG